MKLELKRINIRYSFIIKNLQRWVIIMEYWVLDIVMMKELELKRMNVRHSFIIKNLQRWDASRMYNVGYCYEKGIGVEKDECKAFIYYQKSAEMGNFHRISKVAKCYRNRIGTTR